MTTPFWCLVAVMFFPIFLNFLGVAARARAFGDVDNRTPRLQAAQLEGRGARIYAAQENAWEATLMFGVTVITTHLAGLDPEAAAPWALGYVGTRVLHAVTYIADLDKARTLVFLAGIVCLVTLLVKAA